MRYTIKNELASAQIESLGAELKSYKAGEKEYIYQPLEGFWKNSAPVLFPIVGGVKGGVTLIDGKPCEMNRHGIARASEFEVKSVSDESVTFLLRDSEETLRRYPFRFEFTVTFRLDGARLYCTYGVKNTGNGKMITALGAHPAFKCPVDEGDAFENYVVEFEKPETVKRPFLKDDGLIDLDDTSDFMNGEKSFALSHSLFDNDAIVFTSLESKKVRLYSTKTGTGVEMAFDGFPYFGVWSQIGVKAPFVCLEPWTSVSQCADESGRFEDKKNMISVAPGERLELTYSVTAL